jgi:hypothetical protein
MTVSTGRIEALASSLLDGFLLLRGKYELLEPMLFDHDLAKERGAGKAAHGFSALTHILFLACVQDIAKLACDTDKRAPSLYNIHKALQDLPIRNNRREQFAGWGDPNIDPNTDPVIAEMLKRIDFQEQGERRERFDALYSEFNGLWDELSTKESLIAFRTVRNKVTAHTEIRFLGDKYEPINIGALGIKWGDVKRLLEPMERLVELSGLLVRNAGFAWDSFDKQQKRVAADFWIQKPAAS